MTITTTLGALVQAEAALGSICALTLSAKAAYHVQTLARLVAADTQHFRVARDAVVRELVTAPEALVPGHDAWPVFVERVTELVAVDVTIAWGPITLAMLGDAQVSAQALLALGPLLADPEPEA